MYQKHIEHIFFLHVKRDVSKINVLVFEVESPLVCLVVMDGCQSCENKKIYSANVFFWHSLLMLLIVILSVFCSRQKAEVKMLCCETRFFVNKETILSCSCEIFFTLIIKL